MGKQHIVRILIDAFWWAEGPISNRRVLRQMVQAWRQTHPADELHLAVPRRHLAAVRRELGSGLFVHGSPVPQHGLSTALWLPALAGSIHPDRVLAQNFAGLWGQRFDVFAHDALFVDHPEWFTRAERAYFALMRATWARSRRMLASTSTEAARLQRVRRSRELPTAVGLAVDTQLADLAPVRPAALTPGLPFLLSVGRLNVRKNLGYAISVCSAAGVIDAGRPLVIVGEPNGAAAIGDYPPQLLESGAVRFLGRVTDAELAWLYAKAEAFIFTSRDEGFGLPPLEAAYFGCPLLVSDIPVMREVTAGLDAVYLPLDDTEKAAKLLANALNTLAAGRHRRPAISGYSWPATARALRQAMA